MKYQKLELTNKGESKKKLNFYIFLLNHLLISFTSSKYQQLKNETHKIIIMAGIFCGALKIINKKTLLLFFLHIYIDNNKKVFQNAVKSNSGTFFYLLLTHIRILSNRSPARCLFFLIYESKLICSLVELLAREKFFFF